MKILLLCLLMSPVFMPATTVKPIGVDIYVNPVPTVCPLPPCWNYFLGVFDNQGALASVQNCTTTASTVAAQTTAVQARINTILTKIPTATVTPVNTPTATPVPAVSTTNSVLQSFGSTAPVSVR